MFSWGTRNVGACQISFCFFISPATLVTISLIKPSTSAEVHRLAVTGPDQCVLRQRVDQRLDRCDGLGADLAGRAAPERGPP
jgi:hypothetical protein